MLEKIGLPPRPSMPGGNWVLDASHCQGCQSQFTLFNRKHHCRRCGGLFCNNCTQQRIILRGQGDSPVRICEPCKKIEEAARIELRHGYRTRKAKANSKKAVKNEDEILQEFIEAEKFPLLAASAESDLQEARSSMASSSTQEVPQTPDRIEDIIRKASSDPHNNVMNEVGSRSPEELRRLAKEEKNKHIILKSQGKPDEALAAFKHGKELERHAASLEITLRKNRRLGSTQKTSKMTDDGELLINKKQIPSRTGKSKKDDLANELKELGWSDADAHEVERKPEKQSIESELSSLLRGSHTEKKVSSIDKSQVIAHKKRALELKREGKLAEAKEELKQAKILEKQLEEQEFLAEGDESDDEIAALIRSMGDDKQDDLSFDDIPGQDMNFNFTNLGDDFSLETKFDVTDDDLNDPELAAALKSFGWSEGDAHLEEDVPEADSEVDHKKLAEEVLALKCEAVKHKKAGNLPMAMELLKRAKILEKELESLPSNTSPMQKTLKTPSPGEQLLPTNSNVSAAATLPSDRKQPPKSKAVIQRELLALKRKALALKREGHVEEAEEELRRGKVLELQLEEMEKVPKPLNSELDKKNSPATHPHEGAFMTADLAEVDNTDVTEQDMEDPALLSVLKNLGWEDNTEAVDGVTEMPLTTSGQSKARIDPLLFVKPTKSKSEIQRELLAIKRRALAFRRQGKVEEAEEELRKTADLENQLKDLEAKHQTELFAEIDNSSSLSVRSESLRSTDEILKDEQEVKHQHDHFKKNNDEIGSSTRPDTLGREISKDQKEYTHRVNLVASTSEQVKDQNNHDYTPEIPRGEGDQQTSDSINLKENSKGSNSLHVNDENNHGVRFVAPDKVVSRGEIQKELLAIKRKALALRRQGKLAEAEEESAKAKDLQDQLDVINNIENEHGSLPRVQKEPKVDDMLSVLMNADSMHKDVAVDSARYPEGNHEVKPPFASLSVKNDSSNGQHDALIVPPPREPVNLMDLLTGDNQTKIFSDSVAVVSLPINSDMFNLLSSDDWNYQPFLPNKLDQDARPVYLTLDDPNSVEVAVDSKPSDHLPDQGPPLKNDNKATHGSPNLVFSRNEVNEASPVKEMETSSTNSNTLHGPGSLKDQILSHKRRALMLKREGKLAEAREELKQAKLLERTVEGDVKQANEDNQKVMITSVSADVPVSQKSERESIPVSQKSVQETNVPSQKPMSGRDRFKLQQECLSKKRLAAKLRREGKMDEAESLLEQAKNLQAQIEEIDSMNPNASGKQVEDDALVEDLLDPQLLSALQSLGIGVEKNVSQPTKRTEVKPSASKMDLKVTAGNTEVKVTASNAGTERVQLEEQIKAEKVRALNFKRAGKQAEAMEALRSAKRLEKKLASLG